MPAGRSQIVGPHGVVAQELLQRLWFQLEGRHLVARAFEVQHREVATEHHLTLAVAVDVLHERRRIAGPLGGTAVDAGRSFPIKEKETGRVRTTAGTPT